jgi:hypothetical protein
MNILCSVCARGGSTTLKNKNIKILYGKPLIAHTLITAKKAKIFDSLVVSSDSSKIINISKKYADFTIKRPHNLSHDSSPKIPAIRHVLEKSEEFFNKKFDIIIDLDATAPLRTVKDIKENEIELTTTVDPENPPTKRKCITSARIILHGENFGCCVHTEEEIIRNNGAFPEDCAGGHGSLCTETEGPRVVMTDENGLVKYLKIGKK